MYFEELYQRLLEEARLRVRTGAVTERGLARQCGVSQPHMHNVLKNIRTLSTGSASRLMQALELNIPELLWRDPESAGGVRAVPLIRNRLGPGTNPSLTSFAGYVPFAAAITEGLLHPVAVRLGADLVMPNILRNNDLALLDQNAVLRTSPDADSCWVVAENGSIRVRYVRIGANRIYLANEATLRDKAKWNAVSLHSTNILDVIKARIVWVGRELISPA